MGWGGHRVALYHRRSMGYRGSISTAAIPTTHAQFLPHTNNSYHTQTIPSKECTAAIPTTHTQFLPHTHNSYHTHTLHLPYLVGLGAQKCNRVFVCCQFRSQLTLCCEGCVEDDELVYQPLIFQCPQQCVLAQHESLWWVRMWVLLFMSVCVCVCWSCHV